MAFHKVFVFIVIVQKQPFRCVLKKRCSENLQQILRTPFLENTSKWLLLDSPLPVVSTFGAVCYIENFLNLFLPKSKMLMFIDNPNLYYCPTP